MLRSYEIIDDRWIQLNEGPYVGIVYRYGRVQLLEEGNALRIKFDYELKEGSPRHNDFVQYIGPILTELIEQGLLKNNIVYTGGVDENRDKDPS